MRGTVAKRLRKFARDNGYARRGYRKIKKDYVRNKGKGS